MGMVPGTVRIRYCGRRTLAGDVGVTEQTEGECP